MKKLIILIGILACVYQVSAQNEIDALRYSYVIPGGTSRVNAMGGSFGALGGDPSSLLFNPAGMGVYKSSELTITPSFEWTNSNANYLGKTRSDYDLGFNLGNIAYIGTINFDNNDFSNLNFGFSYNRINSFNENILIEGVNNSNSITDWLAAKGNGISYDNLNSMDNFYSNLAWETYLINLADENDPNLLSYVSALNNRGQTQKQFINRSGYQGEYNFAISGSLFHKLFLGASLGIQTVRYREIKNLEESDPNNIIDDFKYLKFREDLYTRGSGVNFKFGFLYSPVDWMRFGAAIHTPTFFSLRDEFSTSLTSTFENNDHSGTKSSNLGVFDYDLNTPLRANASLGFIIGKVALINVDYEFVDYSKAKLRSNDYTFSNENDNIKEKYKSAHNVKLGAEYRYGPVSFRLGGAFYGSPYESDHTNKDAYTLVYSGGIGFRLGATYIDLAYSLINNNKYYTMYEGFGQYIDSPLAKITKNQSRISATIGFKF